jgi:hypothetical protein
MHVFLEIQEGKYYLRVSPYSAGSPTTMHQRGKPFPESVRESYEKLELATIGLQQLTDYYKCYEEKPRSKQKRASKNVEEN